MKNTFQLNFQQDRPKLDIGDDNIVEFRIWNDFTPGEFDLASELVTAIQSGYEQVQADQDNNDKLKSAVSMSKKIEQMIDLILPDLPQEIRARLSVYQMSQMVGFWIKEQSGEAQGNA